MNKYFLVAIMASIFFNCSEESSTGPNTNPTEESSLLLGTWKATGYTIETEFKENNTFEGVWHIDTNSYYSEGIYSLNENQLATEITSCDNIIVQMEDGTPIELECELEKKDFEIKFLGQDTLLMTEEVEGEIETDTLIRK